MTNGSNNSEMGIVPLKMAPRGMNMMTSPVNASHFYLGILLAFLSSLFIGSSFILKKKGLLRLLKSNGSVRAASGGFGYLYEIQWWAGLVTMALGELCNFAAYGFAPASVVTPLGALSVLVSALMAVRFLNEKLNALGKIGCLLTVFGSIIIIIHAPKESEVNSLSEFAQRIGAPGFLFFASLICLTTLSLIIYYGPRFGTKYIHVYILICSLLGALTVTACQGLSIGLKELFLQHRTYTRWLTFLCAITIIICILIQMIYLNRALDLFSTPIVTTVYYVLFTTCVLVTSGILFREWSVLSFADITACLVGFSVTTCGLILINYLKASALSNDAESKQINDESFFSLLSANAVSQEKGIPNKSFTNLLLDENELAAPLTTVSSSNREQTSSRSLMDDCELHS